MCEASLLCLACLFGVVHEVLIAEVCDSCELRTHGEAPSACPLEFIAWKSLLSALDCAWHIRAAAEPLGWVLGGQVCKTHGTPQNSMRCTIACKSRP